ncbi:hypothetical protein N7520_007664 [Penicillium odoratum]|uniref:uncharacterized protein n=1 Tax=Penicillium odoratum TaxID=1167516 RepID=UPI0025482F5C|nr:uncharacterized protein N7520_007664 [Penicillium odoratum]KAJ5760508.1 hypothetical protein N7520_007664 [Penicillium odoratum]
MGSDSISPTAGLVKTNSTNELLPGQVYIIRFKNPCRSYRTDIWLGVILTEEFGPGKNLHGRAKGAKNPDGTWDNPLSEHVYPIYMPGRNSYRWSHVKDISKLQSHVPPVFGYSSIREEAAIFRKLQKIALMSLSSYFWEEMAEKKSVVKGKRSRDVSLILLDGYENILLDIRDLQEDSVTGRRPDYRSGSVARDAHFSMPQPSRVQAASRTKASSFSYTASVSSDARKFDRLDSAMSGQQTPIFSQKRKGTQPKIEDAGGTVRTSADILQLSIQAGIKAWILGLPGAEEVKALFSHMIDFPSRPGFVQLRSFYLTQDFVPRLVQVNIPSDLSNTSGSEGVEEFIDYQVGDIKGIGRHRQLQDIRCADDLCAVIVSLGNLYTYARRLNIEPMIRMITFKLQVAWNSYPGFYQLEYLLDVTSMVYRDGRLTESEDELEEWIPKFIADTQDLMLLACSVKYQAVMRELPELYTAVSDLRVKLMSEFPGKYTDQRCLLESRGIDQI